MSRPRLFSRGIIVGLALCPLLATACGGDTENKTVSESSFISELPRAMCDNASKCSCEALPSDCEAQVRTELSDAAAKAKDQGLTFDGECGAVMLDIVESLSSCGVDVEHPRLCCKPFNGTAGEGEPCGGGSGADVTCGAGLECESGTCYPICTKNPPSASRGESCAERPCAKGLACNSALVCVDYPKAGESCDGFSRCEDGAWCRFQDDGSSLCVAAAKEGEPCALGDCLNGSNCIAGICVAPKAGGEPCTDNNGCKSYACENGVCKAEPADACSVFF